MDWPEGSDLSGSWTNEKHIYFLNWMEACFVKRMHEFSGDQQLLQTFDPHLPLDRPLPSSSDSTLDLKSKQKHESVETNRRYVGTRSRNTRVNRPSQHESENTSDDQVVPQMESLK